MNFGIDRTRSSLNVHPQVRPKHWCSQESKQATKFWSFRNQLRLGNVLMTMNLGEIFEAWLSGDNWSLTMVWFVFLPFVLLFAAVAALIDKVRGR